MKGFDAIYANLGCEQFFIREDYYWLSQDFLLKLQKEDLDSKAPKLKNWKPLNLVKHPIQVTIAKLHQDI